MSTADADNKNNNNTNMMYERDSFGPSARADISRLVHLLAESTAISVDDRKRLIFYLGKLTSVTDAYIRLLRVCEEDLAEEKLQKGQCSVGAEEDLKRSCDDTSLQKEKNTSVLPADLAWRMNNKWSLKVTDGSHLQAYNFLGQLETFLEDNDIPPPSCSCRGIYSGDEDSEEEMEGFSNSEEGEQQCNNQEGLSETTTGVDSHKQLTALPEDKRRHNFIFMRFEGRGAECDFLDTAVVARFFLLPGAASFTLRVPYEKNLGREIGALVMGWLKMRPFLSTFQVLKNVTDYSIRRVPESGAVTRG